MKPLPKSLIAFTLLSGIGAGLVIVAGVAARYLSGSVPLQRFERPVLVCAFILLCLAFLASAVHLGKPRRAFNALANPGSMIAQEAYWGMAFVLIVAIAMLRTIAGQPQGDLLTILGVIAGAGLLTVTALVYTKARAIPAWNSASTLLAFWLSAALMGSAGSLIVAAELGATQQLVRGLAGTTLVLVGCQALAAIGAEIELATRTYDVELPSLLGLNVVRLVVGLLLPVIVIVLALSGELGYPAAGIIAALAIVLGEGTGRVIFFSRGVHS